MGPKRRLYSSPQSTRSPLSIRKDSFSAYLFPPSSFTVLLVPRLLFSSLPVFPCSFSPQRRSERSVFAASLFFLYISLPHYQTTAFSNSPLSSSPVFLASCIPLFFFTAAAQRTQRFRSVPLLSLYFTPALSNHRILKFSSFLVSCFPRFLYSPVLFHRSGAAFSQRPSSFFVFHFGIIKPSHSQITLSSLIFY